MNARTFCRLFSLGVLFILWVAPASAQSSFYEGKTITIVQGREPGDAGDMRGQSHTAVYPEASTG